MNNIFLFEYVVAGGLGTNIPRDIFLEGLAMYKALYLDLNNLGLKITTCIDKNLHSMVKAHLPLQEFTLVRDCNAIKDIFFDLCCQSEYCCLIAPQTDFILYNFSKLAEKSGTQYSLPVINIKHIKYWKKMVLKYPKLVK
jgi:predicted ATP-grasp superfamily ATP-dependent carboligase